MAAPVLRVLINELTGKATYRINGRFASRTQYMQALSRTASGRFGTLDAAKQFREIESFLTAQLGGRAPSGLTWTRLAELYPERFSQFF